MEDYFKKVSELINKQCEPILDVIDSIISKFSQKYIDSDPDFQKLDEDTKYQITMSIFMEGSCYYFSHMLNKIFENDSKIYTSASNDFHSVVKIGYSFYDVQGNIASTYNRKGYVRSYVDISQYKEADEESYNYFVDLCHIGRNKESIKKIEGICDEVLEEIISERKNKEKKLSQN